MFTRMFEQSGGKKQKTLHNQESRSAKMNFRQFRTIIKVLTGALSKRKCELQTMPDRLGYGGFTVLS